MWPGPSSGLGGYRGDGPGPGATGLKASFRPAFHSTRCFWRRSCPQSGAPANLTNVFSAPPIPSTPAPVAAPIAGRVVVIPGPHRWRCVGRSRVHDNNGRSCRGRCHRSVTVCWSRVIVERSRSCNVARPIVGAGGYRGDGPGPGATGR